MKRVAVVIAALLAICLGYVVWAMEEPEPEEDPWDV